MTSFSKRQLTGTGTHRTLRFEAGVALTLHRGVLRQSGRSMARSCQLVTLALSMAATDSLAATGFLDRGSTVTIGFS